MQAGDVLFYLPDPGDPWEWVIKTATHGPYVHCGMARSATESIEALDSGVQVITNPAPAAIAPVATLQLVPDALANALEWLNRQIGDGYGWLDTTVDQLGRFLPFPTPLLVQKHAYDCSDLVTRALMLASCRRLSHAMIQRPQAVSPNDLARALLPQPPAASGAAAA